MKITEELVWLTDLKPKVLSFLDSLKSKTKPGYYNYSLSGDIYDEKINWGLGNATFAVKILFTINTLQQLSSDQKKDIFNFISSFKNTDGSLHDPLINPNKNIYRRLRNKYSSNPTLKDIIRAETRQAISSIKLLNKDYKSSYDDFPKTSQEIIKYLASFNWGQPWSAGSHFSHLLFFLINSGHSSKEALIDEAISWLNKIQNPKDGAWYTGSPDTRQKINGAMKVITGLKAANRMNLKYPKKLVDLCLEAINDQNACDNFNIIYVLYYASLVLEHRYRYDEITSFYYNRLKIYKQHYFSDLGGFSFNLKRANQYYYGVRVTKGLNEPDIHGTVMFLWGISIITKLVEIDNLKLKVILP